MQVFNSMKNVFKILKLKAPQSLHIFIILLILVLVISGKYLFTKFTHGNTPKVQAEISAILATSKISEQSKLYRQLIGKVGPAEAQEDLYRSGLPFNGQTHLLNHIVGDFLYEKYGTAGLPQCKDYFLSSCYHGFVLHVIGDKGMTGVAETFNECYKLGYKVYVQCAHAIGHGFLANAGYKNLTVALKTCDEAGKTMPYFPVYNCHDGVFMENIWAVHDGKPSLERWVNEKDWLYPCNSKKIDEKYIRACWSNQPSLIYKFSGGDLKKIGDVCLNLKNEEYQEICFDGLARQINPLTTKGKLGAQDLCGMMPGIRWIDHCLVVNATSSFSMGDRMLPYEICGNIREEDKDFCYGKLFGTMKYYTKDKNEFKSLCREVEDKDWRKKCEVIYK